MEGAQAVKITDNVCKDCEKRTPECRLTCGRYKVYHAAKMKEYEKKRLECQYRNDITGHIRETIDRREKRLTKYTPPKNGGMTK